MNKTTEKLNQLASLIKKREEEVKNLWAGLTKIEIQQKINCLPFDFPEELYALYQWRNGIEKENFDKSPFLFRDHFLSNIDDALETYFAIQTTLNTEEDKRIADWSMCFPFADFEGSYLFILLGRHIVMNRYKYPIINVFEGTTLWFYSFDSMLNTCIEWNQESFEKYGTPTNELEIWTKNNPGIFDIDLDRI